MSEKLVWKIYHYVADDDERRQYMVIADNLEDAARVFQNEVSPPFRIDGDSFEFIPYIAKIEGGR